MEVSIINLIATPEKYHNKKVCIVGYTNIEHESYAIYLSKVDADNNMFSNSIYLYSEMNYMKKFNNEYVFLEGTFINTKNNKSNSYGKQVQLYAGALKDIEMMHIEDDNLSKIPSP